MGFRLAAGSLTSLATSLFTGGLIVLCSCTSDPGSSDEKRATDPGRTPVSTAKGEFNAGDEAPPVQLVAVDGQSHSLADYRGKTVLLNFWATWCVPCVMEMPALERLQKILGSEGLTIVGINLDDGSRVEQVREFVRTYGLSFPVLLDPKFATPRMFGVSGFPETFIIGKDGRFQALYDPEDKRTVVRVISDRAWDSPEFVAEIRKLLK